MNLGLLAVPAASLLVVAALLAGCGGSSDALTLEEYFAEFAAIDAAAVAQFQAASADFPVTDDPFADEANLTFFKDLFAAYERTYRDRLASVVDLSAPSEVADAHSDLVDAQEALVGVVEERSEPIQEAETMAEVETLFLGPEIETAAVAYETACFALVDIADANDIAADITCAVDA